MTGRLLGLCLLAATAAHADDEATALLEAGYVDSAIAEFEARLGSNPYDAIALNNLAVTRAREDDVFAAFDLLDRAARLAPEHPVIGENRATLRTWIMRRIETADRGSGAVVPEPPAVLPPPPDLWVP
ncbi:hypothetical protein [Sinimarinibacterium flocculans]|uniref:hypothetical protein n=1 Tax=Sinimarinibacterium flocculans TaxID=985250 RepID=UPI003513026F